MTTEGSVIPEDCASGCPLAMAYVPWQVWNTTYEMEQGFMVGTIFPELDLPFLGVHLNE
ncbi:spore coat associated protein CotJA [Aminipila terrae]|uniref:Spore coat associated protein CotJA n=2 Tax=Aminipila terrae TaxID=2697030 RepID=A0A6P1MGS1_9FIRM|nr:spore coat associated protein CotJA [Aminipila terrae]